MQPFANNVWMEITRREDIGADLKAPSTARGGGVTGSYVLVPVVRPDDVVIHYDSRREAIVGVSVATSSAQPAPIYWVARGSCARRAGAQRPQCRLRGLTHGRSRAGRLAGQAAYKGQRHRFPR